MTVEWARRYRGRSRLARFVARVDYRSPDGCWLWTGALDRDRYGRFTHGRRNLRAHRVMFMLWWGPVPPGLQLDHLCRVHACVNPEHLEPVSTQRNTYRGQWARGIRSPLTQMLGAS